MSGNYITAEFTIWLDVNDPTTIHATTGDKRFVDADGVRPGLRAVFSSNPRSANYSPINYNRCMRAIGSEGLAHFTEPVPELSRKLKDRKSVIEEIHGPPESPKDLAVFGYGVCPACLCLVSDVDAHRSGSGGLVRCAAAKVFPIVGYKRVDELVKGEFIFLPKQGDRSYAYQVGTIRVCPKQTEMTLLCEPASAGEDIIRWLSNDDHVFVTAV